MGHKTKAYTRKLLRRKTVEVEGVGGSRWVLHLSKRWQRHDSEMRRNTVGTEPDFRNLP